MCDNSMQWLPWQHPEQSCLKGEYLCIERVYSLCVLIINMQTLAIIKIVTLQGCQSAPVYQNFLLNKVSYTVVAGNTVGMV